MKTAIVSHYSKGNLRVMSLEGVNIKRKIIVITEAIYIVLLSVGEERFGGGKLSDLKISKVCLFVCVWFFFLR